MKNQKFSLNDLTVLSGFTLYRLNRDKQQLEQIGEAGTSGATKKVIELEGNDHLGVVEVLDDKYDWFTPAINEPYENRVILSFKLIMSDGESWVYNFHFDKEDDDPAFNLLVNSGIIDSREVLRLIHAFCLLLEDDIRHDIEEGDEYRGSS